MQDERLTIRVDSDLKARFKERAAVEGRTLAQVVIRALEQAAKRWVKPDA